jgi:hypothetical protein
MNIVFAMDVISYCIPEREQPQCWPGRCALSERKKNLIILLFCNYIIRNGLKPGGVECLEAAKFQI